MSVVEIRATHYNAFRSGEWARVDGIEWRRDGRACYIVRFTDGRTDSWPVIDPDAGYEFRSRADDIVRLTAELDEVRRALGKALEERDEARHLYDQREKRIAFCDLALLLANCNTRIWRDRYDAAVREIDSIKRDHEQTIGLVAELRQKVDDAIRSLPPAQPVQVDVKLSAPDAERAPPDADGR